MQQYTLAPVKEIDGPHSRKWRIRRLTPVECERLQAFPDSWTRFGLRPDGTEYAISDTQRYKMMGNAVTTNVIEAVARRLPT
jgi:DNA (cytosine-5)-methyltransferase 1